MPITNRDQPEPVTTDTLDYQRSFRAHVFAILEAAYGALDSKSQQDCDEDTITQRLQEGAQAFVESVNAPPWAEHFEIVDQRKDNSSGASGKNRPILDLVFTRTQRGRRPRFTFEAKRLYEKSGEREYLGREGIGAYVDGTYRRDDGEAGMLGYVQKDSPAEWADKITAVLASNPKGLDICQGGEWRSVVLARNLPFAYQTRHARKSIGTEITMYHVLLLFC